MAENDPIELGYGPSQTTSATCEKLESLASVRIAAAFRMKLR